MLLVLHFIWKNGFRNANETRRQTETYTQIFRISSNIDHCPVRMFSIVDSHFVHILAFSAFKSGLEIYSCILFISSHWFTRIVCKCTFFIWNLLPTDFVNRLLGGNVVQRSYFDERTARPFVGWWRRVGKNSWKIDDNLLVQWPYRNREGNYKWILSFW